MPEDTYNSNNANDSPNVRIIPLGGLGEVGMNMMVIETDHDAVIIDCGIQFPEYNTPGIERVIPNMEYLETIEHQIRALLITHGHLDHIGSIPYLVQRVKIPIYAPRLASEIIRNELQKTGKLGNVQIRTINPRQQYNFGEIDAQWFQMCHSIPDSCSIFLNTPQGGIFHTGDFKLDNEPMLGSPTDYQMLSEIGRSGVRLLMSDSTNAEDEGNSRSDRIAAEAIYHAIAEAQGRVIVASFSTQIARVQMIADAAEALDRKIVLLGRSMVENSEIAEATGHLHIPPGIEISSAEANSLPDDKVIIVTTGSQGEFAAGIVRMARDDHRDVKLRSSDTVILSARTIPGNEVAVNEVLNNLAERNVRVITSSARPVHVSGHAKQEELKMMFNMLRPECFTPIHGEYRMLRAHCDIAMDMGVPTENVNLITDGDVLELNSHGAKVIGTVPSGSVLVQGQGEWDPDGSVMEERKSLASDGIVLVALATQNNKIVGNPQIATSGFVDVSDEHRLMRDAAQVLSQTIDPIRHESLDSNKIEKLAKAGLGRFFHRRTKRRPLIMVTKIDI